MPAGNIVAVVRKQEHADKIAKNLGVDAVVAAIGDGPAMEKVVLEKDGKLPPSLRAGRPFEADDWAANKKTVDVVIHTASSGDFSLASPLLEALGKQKAKTGRPVYFVHTSGTSCLADVTGWKTGVVSDADPIYQQEKTLEPYWFRDVRWTYKLLFVLNLCMTLLSSLRDQSCTTIGMGEELETRKNLTLEEPTQVNIAVYEKAAELGIQVHIVIVPYICESPYTCTTRSHPLFVETTL